ncbi:MAG: Valine--tRNA ligase [Planctomycetes bacterium ADurb.Bin126]|nr:MAG: Valine--tRNA ligase [Planctomycetes bacterium ADurb.Bin126]HOD83092.1 valine--tRNA ligase [Phycisphaerae bacterium]HQL73503.1 valine--tRNA ligase [Phycisphaerae bacterium]
MELAKTYEPKQIEGPAYQTWEQAGSFRGDPADPRPSYCIVIPPPNVTAALHLGHALNNTLQDILVRYRRMAGRAALWMPGTDHAGIATQTVVEKRILTEEKKRRTDFTREAFVQRVQAWKDEYEARILNQLQLMGCSCDWDRTRFTMDEICARAVRATFFKLFADGLIYRGKRLVNWDPATQTVLADDEVEHETVKGSFWYLKYPLEEAAHIPRLTGVSPVEPGDQGVSGESGVARRTGAYLPHWEKVGGTYAVTFRLADSLPKHVLEAWAREREIIVQRAKQQGRELTYQERKELHYLYSQRVDSFLNSGQGKCELRNPQVAGIVHDALFHFARDRYELIAWCIMPNHVHVVVAPLGENKLSEILHSWKSFTAKQANTILDRTGQFWQEEYYDHLIRDEEDFNHSVNYVLGNPVSANLKDWPWVGRTELHGPEGHATHGQDARATEYETVTHITVATTRPETMLGDTAVAMNPADPRAKYLVGKRVRLPLVGRLIPIVADTHVVLPDPESDDEKAKFSTGFLKVTPAHDPDDYAIGQRHGLAMVNVMAPDGTISDRHGWDDASGTDAEPFVGMDRFEAREAIVEWFRKEDLLEDVRPYDHQVGHSYRSHVPIEPYLSDQWYVAVKQPIVDCRLPIDDWVSTHADLVEQKDGVAYLKGTDVPVNSLAGLALAPLLDGRLQFTPERYAATYRTWLENLRDWPISRQLWWGHQIPVWSKEGKRLDAFLVSIAQCRATIQVMRENGETLVCRGFDDYEGWARLRNLVDESEFLKCYVCLEDPTEVVSALLPKENTSWEQASETVRKALSEAAAAQLKADESWSSFDRQTLGDHGLRLVEMPASKWIEGCGFVRDGDVLDTWFSSALWPFSTLGWPEPTPELKKFYPGDVLCTAREIITLWVSRMVMMGQYCAGDIPFSDVFIHAMIQDGLGRKMSKSLGNGIDPLDIIDSHGADAMRYTLAAMTSQTQDVRMPVEAMTLPDGRRVNTSPKFDIGRNFCNKLWNASRFVMMNIEGSPAWSEIHPTKDLADAWILSRLQQTVRDVTRALEEFRFNELADTLYHFTWDEFCDWYVEIAKSRINAGEPAPKAILAHCLDVILRMLHPIAPFITEALWQRLNEIAPVRGPGEEQAEPLLVAAAWPQADASLICPSADERFVLLTDLVRQIRNVRTQHNVPPSRKVDVEAEAAGAHAQLVADNAGLLCSQAQIARLNVQSGPIVPPKTAASVASGSIRMYVLDIIDRDAEIARLRKQREQLAKGIASIESKLNNERFVSKAPADVVAKERQRLADYQAQYEAAEASLQALG